MPLLEALRQSLLRRYKVLALLFFLLACAPLAAAAYRQWAPNALLVVLAFGILALLVQWLIHRQRPVTLPNIAEHLNRQLPILEESTQLLLQQPSSPLKQAQRQRTVAQLQTLMASGELVRALPPWPRRRLMLVALVSAALTALLLSWPAIEPFTQTASSSGPRASATLTATTVRWQPPAYTALPNASQRELDLNVAEGSQITWQLTFSAPVDKVWLELEDGSERVAAESQTESATLTLSADTDQIYRLAWRDDEATQHSDYHRIALIRDTPPILEVLSPTQSPHLIPEEGPAVVDLVIAASDDYGIADTRILATVAKGEGEGVKFRDSEYAFVNRQTVDGVTTLTRRWNLEDLGMQPGDELYFRAVISDNRQPEANVSQTAMLMVRWETSEEQQGLAIEGIAIDLVPEYFRSQRQIIIDTEKLIEDAGTVPLAEGIQRSRDLAFDQKSLRLRYGQYLGEEFSTDIGLSNDQIASLSALDNLPDGHEDESYSEHMEHADDHDHEHEGESSGSATQAAIGQMPDFMADFVHTHDSAAMATLFDNETRETLQAALSAMWNAELQLHLSKPELALPHEYRALDLIKQVQQANRIYVKRAGFEPTPLDFDKRLTGELDEVASYQVPAVISANDDGLIADLYQQLTALDAGSALPPALASQLAQYRDSELPADDLDTRLAIARLLQADGDAPCVECLPQIQARLWQQLAPPPPPALPHTLGEHGLMGEHYQSALETLE